MPWSWESQPFTHTACVFDQFWCTDSIRWRIASGPTQSFWISQNPITMGIHRSFGFAWSLCPFQGPHHFLLQADWPCSRAWPLWFSCWSLYEFHMAFFSSTGSSETIENSRLYGTSIRTAWTTAWLCFTALSCSVPHSNTADFHGRPVYGSDQFPSWRIPPPEYP